MKEQIEKMRIDVLESIAWKYLDDGVTALDIDSTTEHLRSKGYRKQINGEWKRIEVNGENYGQVYYQHKDCKVNETQLFPSPHHFCPNCGAKMKGGVE